MGAFFCGVPVCLNLPKSASASGSHICCLCALLLYRSAIFSLLMVTDNIVATGDDDGFLKVVAIVMSLPSPFATCS